MLRDVSSRTLLPAAETALTAPMRAFRVLLRRLGLLNFSFSRRRMFWQGWRLGRDETTRGSPSFTDPPIMVEKFAGLKDFVDL